MRYYFIINPTAGSAGKRKRVYKQIQNLFVNRHGHESEIRQSEYPGHATELARAAADKRYDLIVAVGGDGTMNEVARGVVHSDSALAIVPVGSGNGFARSLHIPANISQALEFILDPEMHTIDCGRINDRYFFGVSGIGLDAVIGDRFQRSTHRGPVPYFYIGIKEYFYYKSPSLTMIADDLKWEIQPLVLAIANTEQYGNGALIAPGADFTDGRLEICMLTAMSAFCAIRKLPHLFSGNIDKVPEYSRFAAAKLHIYSDGSPILFHTDGEPHQGSDSLEITILPGALNVCCKT